MASRSHRRSARRRAAGGLLIEALISLLLSAFGILGFVRLQARATELEFEAMQRTQAVGLVEDMVSRIDNNRARADDYVSAGLLGAGDVADCGGLNAAASDLCEWGNLLRGTTEARAGVRVGSMLAARGCITRSADTSNRYVVSVVWQGLVPTGGAAAPCGAGDATYPNDALRRAVSSTVCVALLRDPPVPSAVSRC